MQSTFSQTNIALIWIYDALLICIPFFLILGTAQLLVAILWRRSETRPRAIKRGVAFLGIAAVMPIVLLVFWRGVVGPSLAAEMKNQMAAGQSERNFATSFRRVGDKVETLNVLFAKSGMPIEKHRFVVVNFFATWCGPCLAELPHLQKLADKYSDRTDVAFVVVGREESKDAIDAFVKEQGYQMTFVADPERLLYSEFAKELIPRTYLIDEDRTILFEIVGFDEVSLKALEAKLQELVKQ